MKIQRIFTFGCSYTQYIYPTWADILRYSTDIPVYNWGISGLGNVGIYHRLLECDLKHEFRPNDVILVQWSEFSREDRFYYRWEPGGTVFHSRSFDNAFLKKYWSINNDVIKNVSAIISANRMFNINSQWSINDLNDYVFDFDDNEIYRNDVVNFYLKHCPQIPKFPQENNSKFYGNCSDHHPDILCHLDFVENEIQDKVLELKIDREKLLKLQSLVADKTHKFMNHQQTNKIIIDLMQEFDPSLSSKLGF